MVHQKIKNSATLMGLVVTLIILIGVFTIMFSWLASNSNQAGVTIDPRYNESFNRVVEQQGELNATVTDIQVALDKVSEASEIYQVAWNGMKFLGTAILASVKLIPVTLGSFAAVTDILASTGVVASVIVLATIGLVAFLVFLVLANLKGEPKMIK